MILSDISVKRPVFAVVLSLLLMTFGYVAYERLSLREYPDIDPPVVTVEVTYPGAPEQRLFQARIDRNFKVPEDFSALVLGQGDDGYLIRLGDVARTGLGVVEDRTFFRGNGVPMVGIGIIRQSTANTIEVSKAVMTLTERLNKNLPRGMSIPWWMMPS